MRKSLPPLAVKFGPANRDSSPFEPDVIEDECGDEESEKYSNDAIADVVEIGVGRLPLKDVVEECECDLETGITDSLTTGRNPARDGRGTSDKGDERCDRFHVWMRNMMEESASAPPITQPMQCAKEAASQSVK
jgi:hypothetical protein